MDPDWFLMRAPRTTPLVPIMWPSHRRAGRGCGRGGRRRRGRTRAQGRRASRAASLAVARCRRRTPRCAPTRPRASPRVLVVGAGRVARAPSSRPASSWASPARGLRRRRRGTPRFRGVPLLFRRRRRREQAISPVLSALDRRTWSAARAPSRPSTRPRSCASAPSSQVDVVARAVDSLAARAFLSRVFAGSLVFDKFVDAEDVKGRSKDLRASSRVSPRAS